MTGTRVLRKASGTCPVLVIIACRVRNCVESLFQTSTLGLPSPVTSHCHCVLLDTFPGLVGFALLVIRIFYLPGVFLWPLPYSFPARSQPFDFPDPHDILTFLCKPDFIAFPGMVAPTAACVSLANTFHHCQATDADC